ncbi:MAG: hypothetical protein WC807_16530 [Hyphomicrobium sp.]|jgi:hypothetical protein
MANHKLKGLEAVPDKIVINALFQGEFAAEMYAAGLEYTQLKWERGLRTPVVMGRSFGRCIAKPLTSSQMGGLGRDAGRHLARGFFFSEIARLGDERARRSLESWVQLSKLYIGS